MAAYARLETTHSHSIAALGLGTILSEYIANPIFRTVFGNDLCQLKTFVHQHQLQDGIVDRSYMYIKRNKHCLEDNLRNYLNGYDVRIDLIVSGFQKGQLHPILNRSFLENLFYQRDPISETTTRLTLKSIILEILRLSEDLMVAIVERCQFYGGIRVKIFLAGNSHRSSGYHYLKLVSLSLGFAYFKLATLLLTTTPNVYQKGFGIEIYGSRYTCFDRITKCRPWSIEWTTDVVHQRQVYTFLLACQPTMVDVLKRYRPDSRWVTY